MEVAELIRKSLETDEAFFTLARLEELTGLTAQYWRKRIDDGSLQALQRKAKGSGSKLLVPRESLIEHLTGQGR
jgi:hypothetical protein